MISKILTALFYFVLAGSSCWAAASNSIEDSAKLQKDLEREAYFSDFTFDEAKKIFFHKKSKEAVTPEQLLLWSAARGYAEGLAHVLLTKSTDLDYTDQWGNFPLEKTIKGIHSTDQGRHFTCARLLLASGANPNHAQEYPLIFKAIKAKDYSVANLLLDAGADVTRWVEVKNYGCRYGILGYFDRYDESSWAENLKKRIREKLVTLACKAISANNIAGLINIINIMKQDNVHYPWSAEKLEVGYGGKPWRDEDGATLLHHAAKLNYSELVRALIAHGISPTVVDNEGLTPAHYAALRHGHESEMVRVLYECGASQDVQDNYGQTPQQFAEKIRRLLDKSGE